MKEVKGILDDYFSEEDRAVVVQIIRLVGERLSQGVSHEDISAEVLGSIRRLPPDRIWAVSQAISAVIGVVAATCDK